MEIRHSIEYIYIYICTYDVQHKVYNIIYIVQMKYIYLMILEPYIIIIIFFFIC